MLDKNFLNWFNNQILENDEIFNDIIWSNDLTENIIKGFIEGSILFLASDLDPSYIDSEIINFQTSNGEFIFRIEKTFIKNNLEEETGKWNIGMYFDEFEFYEELRIQIYDIYSAMDIFDFIIEYLKNKYQIFIQTDYDYSDYNNLLPLERILTLFKHIKEYVLESGKLDIENCCKIRCEDGENIIITLSPKIKQLVKMDNYYD